MALTFRNSPLAEIVAELKWVPSTSSQPLTAIGGGVFGIANAINVADQNTFLTQLQTALAGCGFSMSERLLPPGFISAPQQVAYRYRNPAGSNLFQAGIGVFTANGVPPYRSWHEFEPSLREGLDALLRARLKDEQGAPFTSVSLRYINSFRDRHRNGLSSAAFMRDVLGIYTHTPSVIEKYREGPHSQSEMVQLQIPLQGGLTLSMVITEGVLGAEPGLIADFSVATAPARLTGETDALAILARAHDIIHDIFVETTASIRAILQPEEVGQ